MYIYITCTFPIQSPSMRPSSPLQLVHESDVKLSDHNSRRETRLLLLMTMMNRGENTLNLGRRRYIGTYLQTIDINTNLYTLHMLFLYVHNLVYTKIPFRWNNISHIHPYVWTFLYHLTTYWTVCKTAQWVLLLLSASKWAISTSGSN